MKKVYYDLWIMLELLKECKFHCSYCFFNTYKERIYSWKKRLLGDTNLLQVNIHKINENIKKLDKKCLITLTGGEPFLFPNFIELCHLLTKHSDISIETNLSHKKVYEFADKIYPGRISITTTAHISELEKYNLVEDFIAKVKYLKEKGFRVKVYYVMYPPFFKRFKHDYEFFKSYDILIIPKVFEGKYHFRRYPQAYSQAQKDMIIRFTNDTNKLMLESIDHNLKGKECLAGKSFIQIKNDGRAYKCYGDIVCYGDNHSMGSLIRGGISLYKNIKVCELDKNEYNYPLFCFVLERVKNENLVI